MSSGGNKRSRALCIKVYTLSMQGYTHRQIADLCDLKTKQVPGKVKRGRLAMIREERLAPLEET